MLRRACWLLAIAVFSPNLTQAAGIQFLDPASGLTGAIWYPCAAAAQTVPLGPLAVATGATLRDSLTGVKDCPVAGNRLPLNIISHGRGGWFAGHHDTAAALADAGFVVAAINHPGDNTNDASHRNDLSILATRPADIVRLIDLMLNGWKDSAGIDRERIGFFGFSRGGYTGLVLAGAKPDFRRIARFCPDTEATPACEQFRSGDIPGDPPHDPRINAFVVADPGPTYPFTSQNLAGIKPPLQVWRSELLEGNEDDVAGIARVARSLPGTPDVHVVARAGHWAFLPPCTAAQTASSPRLCSDAKDFDRAAFHDAFNASVVAFFREHLGAR